MKKLILITILMFVIITTTTQAGFLDWAKNLFNENLGIAVRTFMPSQGGTGISSSTASNEGKYLKVSSTTPNLIYSFDTPAGGAGGGSTTTIAGLKPDTDIFFLTSTSGINITTSSPATIQFNLGIATTTQLAITSLAGQTGCLSVSATGKVATSTCSGGTGITSLGGQTGGTQTFSTSTDTNIQLRIVSSADDHQFTPVWAGTLADSRITSANTWNAKITTSSLSSTATGLSYDNVGGVFSWTAGYEGLKTASSTNWNTAYGWGNHATAGYQNTLTFPLVYASTTHITATTPLIITNGVLSMPTSTASQNGFLLGTDWATFNAKITTTSLSIAYAPLSYNNSTGVFTLPTSTASQSGFLSSADWGTFNGKQNNISFPIAVASTSLTGGLGLTLTTNDMACDTASGSVFGCLASADWTTFNNKQGTLSFPLAYASTTHLTATLPLLITAGDLSLTGRLSTINSIATSTGSLIIGRNDTTGWYGLTVGTNGKVLMASSTATNGVNWETVVASASAGGSDTNVQVNEAGAIAGYSTLIYSSSTGLLTVGSSTITGVLTIPNGAGGTVVNSAGQITIDTTTRTLNFYDGTAEVVLNPEQCLGGFIMENPTSTAGTIDNSPGILLTSFNTTSTITKVKGVNTKLGDTFTFNLTYNSNRNSATTTFAVFSAQQTITSTSTLTVLNSFASSTPNKDDILRISFSAASSSHMMIDVCWRQTP